MGPTFRTVKLRGQNLKCAVCGTEPTIKELIDYEQFCSATATDKVVMRKILEDQLCISVQVCNIEVRMALPVLIALSGLQEGTRQRRKARVVRC
jgi:hypothetical protein